VILKAILLATTTVPKLQIAPTPHTQAFILFDIAGSSLPKCPSVSTGCPYPGSTEYALRVISAMMIHSAPLRASPRMSPYANGRIFW